MNNSAIIFLYPDTEYLSMSNEEENSIYAMYIKKTKKIAGYYKYDGIQF